MKRKALFTFKPLSIALAHEVSRLNLLLRRQQNGHAALLGGARGRVLVLGCANLIHRKVYI